METTMPPANVKSSTALKKVLEALNKRRVMFVCCGLDDVPGGTDTAVYARLQDLFRTYTVKGWLVRNDQDAARYLQDDTNDVYSVMLEYRIRWVKWMIEGYEAVND
jgi:hypothetical protein